MGKRVKAHGSPALAEIMNKGTARPHILLHNMQVCFMTSKSKGFNSDPDHVGCVFLPFTDSSSMHTPNMKNQMFISLGYPFPVVICLLLFFPSLNLLSDNLSFYLPLPCTNEFSVGEEMIFWVFFKKKA